MIGMTLAPVFGWNQSGWNVDLLWEYNRGEDRFSGSWSYQAPDGTEYALLGTKSGTAIYRLAEPFAEVGFIPGPVSNWREITVVGQQGYVVTEGSGTGEGMQVIDLSPLPGEPVLLTTYTATFTTGHIIQRDIYSEIPRVYVCGTTPTNGVHILDVSNPADPVQIGEYQPGYYIHDCHVRGNRLYGAAFYNKTLDIVDITDPANPELITTLPDPGTNTHSCSTTPDENFLFLADEADGYPGRLFDISDLDNITQVAQYSANATSLVHNPYIAGDLAILSHNTEGLRIVDIADPSLPVEVGYFDTYDGVSGGFKGLWSACPYFPSGKIIGGDRTRGLLVWEFSGQRAARFYGSVRDSISGAPLPDATVMFESPVELLTLNQNAQFKKGLLPGDFILTASAEGYISKTVLFSLAAQGNLTLDVELVPENWTSATTEAFKDGNSCRIFPNLFSEQLFVKCEPNAEEWDIRIFDARGSLCYSGDISAETKLNIYTNGWLSGIYYCELISKNGKRHEVFKLVCHHP
ncbi:MAG: choice-of-anchor B family protein [Saprospirales bacterium]|nr:choice-of-anchor B family protein [Saprospirales bacterium]